MTKLTRKLMISVFTLAFALVTLGASTFAWFTLSTYADIDPINISVTSGEGIELSTDGTTWRNNIDLADILTQIQTSLPIFDAVTSPNGYEIKDLNGSTETENSKYLSFKLWVRSPSKGGQVYLLGGESGTITNSVGKSWKPDTLFTYTKYGPISTSTPIEVYGANALRFSFHEQSTSAFSEPKADALLSVFELNPADEDAAERNTLLGTTKPAAGDAGLMSYWAAKKIGDNTLTGKLGSLTLPAEVFTNEDLGLDEDGQPNRPISTLDLYTESEDDEDVSIDGFYYGYLRVRIWLEGWDPDSFDSILGTPISITLKFGVVAPAVTPSGEGD